MTPFHSQRADVDYNATPAALSAAPEVQALVEAAVKRALEAAETRLLECSVWCDSQERTSADWHNGVTDARKHHMSTIRAIAADPAEVRKIAEGGHE